MSRALAARIFCAALFFLLLSGCAGLSAPEGVRWQASPNFDERRPNFIILHQTTNAALEPALRTLTDPQRKVSAHYLIGRDGTLIQLVDEKQRAWHAGQSWWGGLTDLNSASIGIELDNTGDEPFAEPQILRLLDLLTELRERHKIPATNVLAHGDVAPRRKVDPSHLFPWERLARAGHGLWCFSPVAAAPLGFDPTLAMQALGYDLSDEIAARRAFRRHFLAEENGEPWRRVDIDLLACLLARKVHSADASRDLP